MLLDLGLDELYARGIPEDTTGVFKQLKETALNGGGVFSVTARDLASRWKAASNLLLASIAIGRTVFIADMNEYIDAHINKEGKDGYKKAIDNAATLWLRMDFLRGHAWTTSIFSALMFKRIGKSTIVTHDPTVELPKLGSLKVKTFNLAGVVWK